MALTIEAAEAKIRFYEEQKKLLAKRDTEVPELTDKLESYSGVLTVPQRRRIAKLVGATLDEDLGNAPRKKATKKATKKGNRQPKYRIPSGDTWVGIGRVPQALLDWEASDEGKAWQAENPDQRFPLAEGQSAPAKKAAKKTTKKAAKKRAKKAGRKATKKGAGKS